MDDDHQAPPRRARRSARRSPKERPILFTGAMVRAVLGGTKTQTRRVAKHAHAPDPGHDWKRCLCREIDPEDTPCDTCAARFGESPYGVAGDQLYVREAWRCPKSMDAHCGSVLGKMCVEAGYRSPWVPIQYEANGARDNWDTVLDGDEVGRYRHARFMPRWASRIQLEVTGVRVERVSDISEEDAKAEGVAPSPSINVSPEEWARFRFRKLWDAINAKRDGGVHAWAKNPWVWVVEFRRLS